MPLRKILDLKQCELCGKRGKLVDTIIEGSLVSVCDNCTHFGKTIVLQKRLVTEGPKIPRKIKLVEEKEFITKEYPQMIKRAREERKLLQKQLAEQIGEKESVIHQLESGHLEPSLVLAKKLEHFFNIRLIEKHEEPNEKINFSDAALTIGDVLKLRRK